MTTDVAAHTKQAFPRERLECPTLKARPGCINHQRGHASNPRSDPFAKAVSLIAKAAPAECLFRDHWGCAGGAALSPTADFAPHTELTFPRGRSVVLDLKRGVRA